MFRSAGGRVNEAGGEEAKETEVKGSKGIMKAARETVDERCDISNES